MYKILLADVCLPDFFSGSHLPVIQIPVDKTTTYHDLQNSLLNLDCIDHLWDSIDWLDDSTYVETIELMFLGLDLDSILKEAKFAEPVTDEDSDIDLVYAFFILEQEDSK